MNAPPGQPPGGRPPYGQPGQMSFDPQTGKPIQPQQPAQPVYQPQQPAQPAYRPQQPAQPAQPVYQPQPAQPVYRPQQPAQPVYQPQQPAQPVYQPQPQAQPVYRPQQPAQPVYQPQPQAQPVYQPQAQMQQARPMPGAAQPVPMAQPMPMAPAAPKKDETLALVAVLLAAAAWVLQFHIFMAVPAVICGHMARKKIKKEPDKFGGDGMAKAGIIIGWINIGLWVLGGIITLLFVVGTCVIGMIGAAAGG